MKKVLSILLSLLFLFTALPLGVVAEGDTLTIADAIAIGSSMAHNTYTEEKYYVTGVITEVYNTVYGNMKIADDAGNILTIYGTFDADGTNRYDAMEVKPVAGDTVTIYGIAGQYNGTAQIKNGWIVEHIPGAGGDEPVDPDEPVEPGDPASSATIDFTDKANRVSYSSKQQIWAQNGITVTNDKGASTSNVGDYGGEGYPARFFKSSTVTIEAAGMTQLIIDCNGLESKYINGWVDSITDANATGSISGGIVTIVFAKAVNSFTWETLSAQSRACSITVYFGEAGGDDEPEIPVEPSNAALVYGTLSQSKVTAGQEFTLTVNIENNPGLIGWRVSTTYDETVFELIERTAGTAFPANSMSFGPISSPLVAVWVDAINPDVTNNGSMYSCTFRVKGDAALGNYTFGFSVVDCENFFNRNFEVVPVMFVDATITVSSPCDIGLHTASEGVVTSAPTCGTEGTMTYRCDLCSATFTESIPVIDEHTYDNACDDTCNVCNQHRLVGDHVYSDACDTICNECDAVRTAPHSYTNGCDRDCNLCGAVRTAPHVYTNACDRDCNLCGAIWVPTHVHRYECATRCYDCGAPVTPTIDHTYSYACDTSCDVCGESRNNVIHTYSDPCDIDCNACGQIRTAEHLYDHACDPECNLCGVIRYVEGHTYDGGGDPICNNCGAIREVAPVPEDAPAFVVDNANACYGKTFTIAIRTRNNPGVVSYRLRVHYDTDLLELISAEEGAFAGITYGPTIANPFVMTWCDTVHPDNTTDDVVTYLTFRAKEGVDPTETTISLTYDLVDVYNTVWESVYFYPISGTVQLMAVEIGDVNDDGQINTRDLGLLQRYLNGWDVEIVLDACDIDANGKINVRDFALLERYLNGWDVQLGAP